MTAHPLQEQAQQAVGSGSTLVNLSAYLTLDRAREKFGFDPANYNLSDNEAGQIATIFSRFDLVSLLETTAIVTSFWVICKSLLNLLAFSSDRSTAATPCWQSCTHMVMLGRCDLCLHQTGWRNLVEVGHSKKCPGAASE